MSIDYRRLAQIRLGLELLAGLCQSAQWKTDKKGRVFLSLRLPERRTNTWFVKTMVIYHTQPDTWRILVNCIKSGVRYIPADKCDNQPGALGEFVDYRMWSTRTFVLKRTWGNSNNNTTETSALAHRMGLKPEQLMSWNLFARVPGGKVERLVKANLSDIGTKMPYWWAYESDQWGVADLTIQDPALNPIIPAEPF